MKESAAAMKKNDPQRKELQQVIAAYGAPNDPKTNIKTVLVNPAKADGTPALPRKITGQVGENGVVAVSLENINAKAGGDSAKAFTILGGTLTHEGSTIYSRGSLVIKARCHCYHTYTPSCRHTHLQRAITKR